jgi:hypothetical protein
MRSPGATGGGKETDAKTGCAVDTFMAQVAIRAGDMNKPKAAVRVPRQLRQFQCVFQARFIPQTTQIGVV